MGWGQKITGQWVALDPWEGESTANPGNCFQSHEGQENKQLLSAWFHPGLTNVMSFYDEMVCLMDERRSNHIACVDFSKAFDSISHNILTEKLLKYLDWMSRLWGGFKTGWMIRNRGQWAANCNWGPRVIRIPQGWLTSSFIHLDDGIEYTLNKFMDDT